MKKILVIGIILLFIASSISISNEAGEEIAKNERIIAKITYKSNESIAPTLQPTVVITQPEDGAVVTDPHLVVLGYASDEIGMNYWEWEWHYKGGSYSNSSYFETAQYVEFRIDIYGLHPGWNLIIVRFKNIYGAMGEDSVNVTYKSPNNPPNKPSKPEGPTKGKVKTTLFYSTVTTDPDGDSLEYLIDWGDGTNTGWMGPIASGYPFQSFHAWDEPGIYEVKAKARDIPYYAESEWSEPLIVTISPEDTEPPVVVKEYPPNGATFTEPNITAWGYITDNVGVVSFGYTQEWEGGGTGSSWPLEEPTTNYSFEIPLTLHEGWNRIKVYATDEAGNVGYDEETVTYVVEDTIPPTTTKIVGEPQYDDGFYVTSETPFTLIAEDNEGGSGVKAIYYRIWNNGSWTDWMEYSHPFTLPGECFHYLEYYAIDNAGNEEEVHNQTHSVDNDPPVTSLDISEPYYLENTTELGEHWVVSPDTVFDIKGGSDRCDTIEGMTLKNRGNKQINLKVIKKYKSGKKVSVYLTVGAGKEKKLYLSSVTELTFILRVKEKGKVSSKKVILGRLTPFGLTFLAAMSGWQKKKVRDDIFEYKPKKEKDEICPKECPSLHIVAFKIKECKKGIKNCFSGTKSTKYRLWHDGIWNDWQKATRSFKLMEEGLYYLEYYSEDNLGNTEEINNETIVVMTDIHSPDKPSRPEGPTSVKVGKNYTYTASTIDIDGDNIYYLFDWGDGNCSGWFGPYEPGETCEASYIWSKKGNYTIRVISRDEYFCYSEWSDPLPIVVPYSFNIKIERPKQGYLYIFGNKIIPLRHTIIIGPIKIGVNGNQLNKVEFYIDEKLKYVAYEPPFTWTWNEFAIGRHEIKVVAFDFAGNTAIDEQKVWIFNI